MSIPVFNLFINIMRKGRLFQVICQGHPASRECMISKLKSQHCGVMGKATGCMAPLLVPSAPFPNQFFANTPGKIAEDSLNARAPHAHMGDREAPGFRLTQHP